MAITNSYLTSTKNLESIINSVINAKAPERFTNKFLEDLGYKSSNDRLVIGMFKALGLLDDNGQPLQRYYEFLDQTQTGRIIAIGIEEAYEDLFNLRKDAQNLTNDEVKNKLKTITQGQKSDKILGLMAMTFSRHDSPENCTICLFTLSPFVEAGIFIYDYIPTGRPVRYLISGETDVIVTLFPHFLRAPPVCLS